MLSKLDAISRLQDGWDGPGSSHVGPPILEAYRYLVSRLSAPSADLEPMPTPSGGIRMEWDRGDTNYVVELEPGGGMFLCSIGPTPDDDFEFEAERVDINTVIDFYVSGVVG